MSYLIAVVANRIAAEEAYTALEQAGFTQKALTIIGTGYKTADEFGLVRSPSCWLNFKIAIILAFESAIAVLLIKL